MKAVHVFTRDHQPATRFVVEFGSFQVIEDLAIRAYIPRRKVVHLKPRARVFARCCAQLRHAQHCTTQVYYDEQPFWCRKGRGCRA